MKNNQLSLLPLAVKLIGQLHFEGNIIPHEFYSHIKTPAGKTDLSAITILADIIYWYRPTTSESKPPRKKFTGDMFQCYSSYFVEKFGLTEKQIRLAFDNLKKNGLIKRELRTITKGMKKFTNVPFVEPVPHKIAEIISQSMSDQQAKENRPSALEDRPSALEDRPSALEDRLLQRIHTETSTKKKTHTELGTVSVKSKKDANLCVCLEFANEEEERAWEWSQGHKFWKGRIINLDQLRTNLKPGKAFLVQFDQTKAPVSNQPISKPTKPKPKISSKDCPYCNERGLIELAINQGSRFDIKPCSHDHDEIKRLIIEKDAYLMHVKPGFKNPFPEQKVKKPGLRRFSAPVQIKMEPCPI